MDAVNKAPQQAIRVDGHNYKLDEDIKSKKSGGSSSSGTTSSGWNKQPLIGGKS